MCPKLICPLTKSPFSFCLVGSVSRCCYWFKSESKQCSQIYLKKQVITKFKLKCWPIWVGIAPWKYYFQSKKINHTNRQQFNCIFFKSKLGYLLFNILIWQHGRTCQSTVPFLVKRNKQGNTVFNCYSDSWHIPNFISKTFHWLHCPRPRLGYGIRIIYSDFWQWRQQIHK